jgi:hypothetical protein
VLSKYGCTNAIKWWGNPWNSFLFLKKSGKMIHNTGFDRRAYTLQLSRHPGGDRTHGRIRNPDVDERQLNRHRLLPCCTVPKRQDGHRILALQIGIDFLMDRERKDNGKEK